MNELSHFYSTIINDQLESTEHTVKSSIHRFIVTSREVKELMETQHF